MSQKREPRLRKRGINVQYIEKTANKSNIMKAGITC